jgi:hypothetical protein
MCGPAPPWHAAPMSRAASPTVIAMPDSTASPVLYVECDVPEGMTLSDWRRRRHPAQPRPSRVVAALQRAVGLR